MSLALLFQPGAMSGTAALSASLVSQSAFTAALSVPYVAPPRNYGRGTSYRMQPDLIPNISHAPLALLDYTIDWGASSWLDVGETISSQTITADPSLTIVSVNPYPANAPTSVQIWVQGGTLGTLPLVTCQIQTTTGRIDQRSIRLQVMRR